MTFTFSWVLFLQLIIGVVLPLVVGLVTKHSTSSGLKALLLAGLALVSSLLTEILNAAQTDRPYDVGQGLLIGLVTFVTAVGVHYGLLKPTGATDAVQAVGDRTPIEVPPRTD
ncbi:hypothetical protein F8O04_12220 [Pseudoclavibacter endophyticus]|uniref:Holin n=1 Tax=Pseudoclavibacter endophyticus TaxID=1778590 RepID=A0A6H9WBG0_9MICO|nr:hypothetical protein F8O04_12220 [Pseudoclavibacter endophyticus]